MKRNEIDEQYKWDLSDIYKSDEDLKNDLDRVVGLIKKFEGFKGSLLKNRETLKKFFDLKHETEEILEKCEVYCYCATQVSLGNQKIGEYLDRVTNLINEYNQITSYVVPEFLTKSEDEVMELIKKDNELAKLERYFKELFRVKKHVLSEQEETILSGLNLAASGYSQASTFITDKEIDYGSIQIGDKRVKLMASNLRKYLQDENRTVRKKTFLHEVKALRQYNDSLATNLIYFIKAKECEAKYRHFSNVLEQKFYDDELDLRIYDTLKESVIKNKDAYLRYVDVFKKYLGYDKLYSYDMYAPLFDNLKKVYTVLEAKKIILETFSILGKKYQNILEYAFDGGCIDYYPCEEKATGWSSIYTTCTIPKVFANFEGKILDISSLCHELGHFCNQYLSQKNNIPEYVYQSTFCAEVASLTNEILFSNIYEPDSLDDRKQLIFNFVKTFASNFFGASRQALFEERVHALAANGEALSSGILNSIWLDVAHEVCGDEVLDYSPYAWSSIPHFFLGGGYYVYNYATAIVAATNVASKIMTKENGFLEAYLEFLKVGSSKSPEESLRILGIDMKDAKTYDVAIKMFMDALDKL